MCTSHGLWPHLVNTLLPELDSFKIILGYCFKLEKSIFSMNLPRLRLKMEACLKRNTSKKIRKDFCMLDIIYGRQKIRKIRALDFWFVIVICFEGCNSREDIIASNLIKEVTFSPCPLLTFDVCLLVSDELILTMVACTTVGSVSFGCSEVECSRLGFSRVEKCRLLKSRF